MKKYLLLALSCALLVMPSVSAQETTTRTARIARLADGLKDSLIAQRRDFHAHPELSNREERTARVIAEKLRALGLTDIKTGVGKHGVTALLVGAKPGPVVAVRADIDALPINETADVPYKSLNAGVKHACGHDGHITMELGVAEVLSQMRGEIAGTIKFIFQPAEEGPPAGEEGGAPLMIKEGVLENPRPSAIFGLHVMPDYPVGTIAYNSGAAMASSDTFSITLRGKGAHGARPHNGIDTVVVAAEAIMALQTIRSRRIDTQEPLVLTFGKINGGTRHNILAEEVTLDGTLRAHSEDVRTQTKAMMRQILQGVTQSYGATFELNFTSSNFVTYNDPQLTADTLPTLRRIMGEKNLLTPRPQMVSEDFSAYQQVIPGFFYFLGVGNSAKGITAPLHTAAFEMDEDALPIGVKAMSNILLDYLDKHGK